jgi:hypothetical protein
MAVTMLAGTRWAMNSATDGIARRAPASAVRTREEARRIAVGRMSWTQLALTTFVIPGWIVATGNRPPEGPLDWLLLALAAASAVVGIVGAVRKLVFERRSG